MTYASKSHEAAEAAERIRDELQQTFDHIDTLKRQLADAEKQVDLQLLLADLASMLREVPTRNLSEGQRHRLAGLRKRLSDMRAA
jgi:energy-coupling factor transporter ATP-binding protein EcfA2